MNAPETISIDMAPRGAWEVVLPVRGERVLCGTLNDAIQVGYRYAADGEGCELVVHDAYHRVLRRELVGASSAHN